MQSRAAAVAGMFYPAGRNDLASAIDALLAGARATHRSDRAPKAIVVPHAGYVYSGPVAAAAFAAIEPFARAIERVVLIGPAHRVYVHGLAAPAASAFETPLGSVRVDAAAFEGIPFVADNPRAHAREHSLEVEVPFLQTVVPHAVLVPLLVSDAPPEIVGAALEALWGGDETLVVVSSDLSHYAAYEVAQSIDRDTASRIVRLESGITPDQACGSAAINGLCWVARRKHLRARLIDLRNSGDTAGPRDQVVGYGAFAFDDEEKVPHVG